MNRKYIYMIILLAVTFSASAQKKKPSDPNSTKETTKLFKNLLKLQRKAYLVGHQDALAYGVNWKYIEGKSDVKDLVGDYPGIYGYELGHIEIGAANNLDSVPFDKMKSFIRDGYRRGGVITISWHGNNPLTGKSAWDAAPGSVASVLPGQPKHKFFLDQLDKVADFLGDLKGPNGEAIPILFRPFHELTGDWFWWGVKSSSPEEFKDLFRFTIDYLRNKRELHNLLVGYNTSGGLNTEAKFLERYPGDRYVDVISFDSYQRKPEERQSFKETLESDLSILQDLAKKRKKIAAIGEVGYNKIPDDKWFTEVIQASIEHHDIAYVIFWRNAGFKPKEQETEFYTPYPNHSAANDFLQFYSAPETLFEKEAAALKLYK